MIPPFTGNGMAMAMQSAEAVLDAIGAAYEQWDGKGGARRLRGDSIALALIIAHEPALAPSKKKLCPR